MKAKKLTYETSSVFSIITVIVVLAIVGLISQLFFHARLDLTEDKKFTLGSASVNTLKNLPDLVTIKAVISTDLPTQFVQIKTHVKAGGNGKDFSGIIEFLKTASRESE